MDVLNGFRNTFNELLKDSEKSINELSEDLNTSPYVILKWKNRTVDLKMRSLIKIADYFDCSLEYLCGKTQVFLDYEPKACPLFCDRIVTVLSECHVSSYSLFKNTKVRPAQYHHWRTGTEPLLSSLETIAEHLEITLDYLLGRDR